METEAFFGCPTHTEESERTEYLPQRNLRWKVWDNEDSVWAEQVVNHYNRYSQNECVANKITNTPSHRPIPRIIHFVWLGPSPIPNIRHTNITSIESFRASHPDWDIRIWRDEDIVALPLQNKSAFHAAAGNYGRQSDIARYEILHNFGGVYIDVDYRCIGTLDDLHSRCEFYCGASNAGTVELNNGLIGCAKGHWVMSRLIERIKQWHDRKLDTNNAKRVFKGYLDSSSNDMVETLSSARVVMETIEFTGPGLFTRVVCDAISTRDDIDSMLILPAAVFHPFPNHLRHFVDNDDIIEKFIDPEKTITVHMWECSWH